MTSPNTHIRITAEPVDDRQRRFVLDKPVHPVGARTYASPDEAIAAPVVQAVLSVSGVRKVTAAGNVLTVVHDGGEEWTAVDPKVRYAIETASSNAPASLAPPADPALGDDSAYELVERLFRERINPAVAQHGGKVELIDVQEGVVVVRMMGGCQGCGMANVTLRQGIETSLRHMLPGLKGIRDITDHASGKNPYFS
jgi:Fe-S cluster biogenesis protein NfuA